MKSNNVIISTTPIASLPSWERGLKSIKEQGSGGYMGRPHAGARIEINRASRKDTDAAVAPIAGARIELGIMWLPMAKSTVVPSAGARGEIGLDVAGLVLCASLPLRERGLK